MDKFEKILKDYKEYAIEVLSKLISFESVLDEYNPYSDAPFGLENKKALEYLLDQARKDGFLTKNVNNYAGHIEFGSGDEILGILAHLDVVPVQKTEWESDPFTLSLRDGRFYARGAIDDKGPLVAAYIALKILKDKGFNPKRKIRLIVGCDEESGSRCLERYLSVEEKPTLGFSPDADFPLIYGEKGMLSYDIEGTLEDDIVKEFICGTRYNIVPSVAKMKLNKNLKAEFIDYLSEYNYNGQIENDYYIAHGVAAHAMCPENGVNAAYILFDFLAKNSNSKLAKFMKEYFIGDTFGYKLGYNVFDPEMLDLTSNLAIVQVEDNKFRIGVNCRIPVNNHFEVIENCLKAATEKYGYRYRVISKSNRHYVDPNSNLVQTLMHCYQEVTKDYKSKPITIGGGTYAREIGNAVAFGPLFVGREDVCHIANEYMIEEDFYKSIEIYLQAIYELSKDETKKN